MSYPINAPVDFTNTNGTTDTLNFNADGPTANAINKIQNFVVTTAGDTLYRASGANNYLERLPVGTNGQVMTVTAGLPSWTSATASQAVFNAFITGSTAGIPTSRVAGANPGTWFSLSGNVAPAPYVTWSTAAPGVDPDAVFVTAAGVNYGRFVVPTTGIYHLDALINFDSGTGVNSGSGLPAAPLPSGSSVRQAQIYNVTTATPLATLSEQVNASNSNPTPLSLSAVAVSLTVADLIEIRVRHDRTAANTATIGAVAISLPSQSYFTGRRIR